MVRTSNISSKFIQVKKKKIDTEMASMDVKVSDEDRGQSSTLKK